jgi:hypothetical protein
MSPRVGVALELSTKRTFATAIEWPGWSRAGRDESAALDALLAYGPRYAAVLRGTTRSAAPRSLDALEVVERLPGNATTDFGAPGAPPAADADPVTARELARLSSILRACWSAFDAAAAWRREAVAERRARRRARSREDPRARARRRGRVPEEPGGTRGVDPVRRRCARPTSRPSARGPEASCLTSVPRGFALVRRYAVRRAAWHVLDHTWEIEDRVDDVR